MQVPKFNASALLAMLAATATVVSAQQPAYVSDPSCKLVTLSDDFKTQTKLDASKWFVQNASGTPKFTKDGLELHLNAVGQSYVIASQKSFKRGTFTMMMKGYNAPGFVSTGVTRPPAAIQDGGDEIDIVELVGARPTKPELVAWRKSATAGGAAQHIQNGNNGYTAVDMGVDMTTSVHNYTTVWDTDSVKWYYDNKVVYTVNLAASGEQRLTQDMQFKFGPWVGSGSWSGDANFGAHPDPFMLVESVSVTGCQTADLAPAGSSSSSSAAASSSTKATSSTPVASSSSAASSTKASATSVPASSSSVSASTTTAVSAGSSTSTPVASSTITKVQNGTTYVYQASGCTESAGATATPTGTTAGTSNSTISSSSASNSTLTPAKNGTTTVSDLMNSTSSATSQRTMVGSSFMALAGGLMYYLF